MSPDLLREFLISKPLEMYPQSGSPLLAYLWETSLVDGWCNLAPHYFPSRLANFKKIEILNSGENEYELCSSEAQHINFITRFNQVYVKTAFMDENFQCWINWCAQEVVVGGKAGMQSRKTCIGCIHIYALPHWIPVQDKYILLFRRIH